MPTTVGESIRGNWSRLVVQALCLFGSFSCSAMNRPPSAVSLFGRLFDQQPITMRSLSTSSQPLLTPSRTTPKDDHEHSVPASCFQRIRFLLLLGNNAARGIQATGRGALKTHLAFDFGHQIEADIFKPQSRWRDLCGLGKAESLARGATRN